MDKHCDTCAHSWYDGENRQNCGSPDYNGPGYTLEMFLEDRDWDHCRFWTPKIQIRKGSSK